MCGIAGVVSAGGGMEVTTEVARQMAGTLQHRGPDYVGTWVSPSGRCALGHARLRVIDLSTGDQPLGNQDGSVQVAFNGEIYNFRELREQLRREGHEFRTASDTEVLLHGYESWGTNVVDHLEGMFACAIWDETRSRLVLIRDRAGKKPLYLSRSPAGVAFGSEMKSVLAHPQVSRGIDATAIPLYLAYGYVPGAQTVFREISKLPPATVAVREADGSWSERRYWSPSFRPERIPVPEAVTGVRERLEAAVGRRLESDVPLGAFLSGGVDSTAIVGIMSGMSERPVRTFSIGFEGHPDFDESEFASNAAQRFGTEHTEFKVGPQPVEFVDALVDLYDEPFGDSSAIPTYIVSRLAREHVTVALTGDGGDELFAGYPRFQGMRLAELIPGWLRKPLAAFGSMIPHDPDFRSPWRRAQRFLAAAGCSPAERLLMWTGSLRGSLDEILVPGTPVPDRTVLLSSLAQSFSRANRAGTTSLSRSLAANFDTYLPEDLLVKADRCSMAHGLELRSPFLDRDLVEFAARLPDSLKVRRGTLKWVLKESVRDLVPTSILSRGKMGFGVPLAAWLRGPWRPLLEDRVLADGSPLNDWVRAEVVADMVGRHVAGTVDFSHQLWSLITLDAWLRKQERRRT